jgi:5-amino-6-(5-phosphoribosylamino)uracil reductase
MTVSATDRPHVILSVAMSVDGCIDDTRPQRLILSNPQDLDAVDALRAECDAILVGAGTIRADNPRLLVRSEARRQQRLSSGLPADPMKVALTESGQLDANRDFFQVGKGQKIVYCGPASASALRDRLEHLAAVVALDVATCPEFILADLFVRGVRKLLIEGGSAIFTLFLEADAVDEMRLAIAPFFVGDEKAPRFVNPGRFPHSQDRRMTLTRLERFDDVTVIWYGLRSTAS